MSHVEYDLPGATNHANGKPRWSRASLDRPSRTIAAAGVGKTRLTGPVEGTSDYRVPDMAEVRAVPDNGYRVVSTFSGAGGTSTGFRMAGFRVLYAVEFVPAAVETYRANWPEVHVDDRDIRTVTADDIRAVIGDADLDVLEGSPPCDPFSMAGKRQKKWGKVKDYSDGKRQRTDDLTLEYVRLVRDLRPRIFVMENVAGLVSGKAKGYYLLIREALEKAGYRVEARILDAQWLGVPQMRRRVIIIGIRDDQPDMVHQWPVPHERQISLREAIAPMVTKIVQGAKGYIADDVAAGFEGTSLADRYDEMGTNRNHPTRINLKRSTAGPSHTVVAMGAGATLPSVVHPDIKRKFSIDELKAIGSFPPDYILTGTYAQRWERIGQSVPPLMAKAYVECIREMLG